MSVCSSTHVTHVHLLPSSQDAGWVLEWSDSGHVTLEAACWNRAVVSLGSWMIARSSLSHPGRPPLDSLW